MKKSNTTTTHHKYVWEKKYQRTFSTIQNKKIKSNLEINVAQCHECLKKGPYLLKSIPTKHPHAVRPKYPYSFYGMPKSLLLDLSFVSILFVCASVHNKKIHLIYITSFCAISFTFVVFFYRRFSCLVFISLFLVCFLFINVQRVEFWITYLFYFRMNGIFTCLGSF